MLSILLGSALGFAYAEPKVVAAQWDKWIEEDGKGYGADIFHAATDRMGVSAKLAYFPAKRAFAEFKASNFDCYLGGDPKAMSQALGMPLASSKPLFLTQYVAYTLKTKPTISSLAQLQEKTKVGIVRGINVTRFHKLGIKAQFDEANSIAINVRKLKAAYIDVYLGTYPEVAELIKDLHFDPELVLTQDSDALHCKPGEENQHFVAQFDAAIDEMRKDGTFQRILDRYK